MTMRTIALAFGAWEPDQPSLGGGHALEAQNVIPAKTGYRCLPSFAPLEFPAVPARVLGAYSIKTIDGSLYTLASTASGLYSLENSLWVQKYTGTALSDNRRFTRFGDDVYALFGKTLLKTGANGVYSAFSAVPSAPTGSAIGVFRDFLVVGNTGSGGNCIQWSAINNADSWPTVGSDAAIAVQSDAQTFPEGGNVQALVGGIDGLVFMEEAVYRASYVGPSLIFQFDPVDRRRGTCAPLSPVVCDTRCIYLSSDG